MAASHKARRSVGEGSVYLTSDGRWRATLVVTHPHDGRSQRRWVSGRSRAETVRKLDALKREAASGFPTGETTGAYLARWVENVRPRLRPATHREYARHVRSYLSPLARLPLTRLTPADVERVMA
ncbi:MAG: tyrosine-type recombinase/integrase, partial [Candidatus Limnocylindrales bacterium]